MTPQLIAIFKKSLRSDRWDSLDLGPPEHYTHENMVARWFVEKNKWLEVSELIASVTSILCAQRVPVKTGPNAEPDVRGAVTSGPIPQNETEPVRLAVRRTMK